MEGGLNTELWFNLALQASFYIQVLTFPQPRITICRSFLNMPDKIRKRQSEAIRRKKRTVIENIHKLGQFPGIDVAFIIRQNRQYTFYQSVDLADFPPPKEQIVSKRPAFDKQSKLNS